MKKILLTAAAVFLCIAASAGNDNCRRENLNEINLMYGVPSATWFGIGTGFMVSGAVFKDVEHIGLVGAFTGEYFRYTNSGRWAFGAGVSYENVPVTYKAGHVPHKGNCNCITIMPSAKVVWFNRKIVGMYSKVGAGLGLTMDKNADNTTRVNTNFAFQLNPVCLELGNDTVRGFLELGFGMQGLAQIGIRYNL